MIILKILLFILLAPISFALSMRINVSIIDGWEKLFKSSMEKTLIGSLLGYFLFYIFPLLAIIFIGILIF